MTQLSARRPSAVGLASLEHWAYSEIKESIISLALPPGTTLVEAQLAEQLGVSKTPLRAALLQLEREGFVVSVPYKGSSVTPITVESVRQLAQIRFALEGYAVYNAAMSFARRISRRSIPLSRPRSEPRRLGTLTRRSALTAAFMTTSSNGCTTRP